MDLKNNLTIRISSNKLQAYLCLSEECLPSKTEIYQTLQANNIVFGIKESTIEQLISENKIAGEYLIAEGIESTNGENSKTIFNFNPIPFLEREPLKRDDDSIDFYNKGIVDYVNENAVIATITPPTLGVNGKTVHGEILHATNGKLIPLHYDETISYSEKDHNFRALFSGHPILKDNTLSIKNIFEVTNVDLSTGNIIYDGDILIRENIRSGFDVTAGRNIEIQGSVHHSNILAGGNIVCLGGKIAGEKGSLVANGNITISYVAGGEIKTGDCLIVQKHLIYTKVFAKNAILCNKTDGLILGGRLESEMLIQTFDLGSHNETKTEIILDNITSKLNRLKEIELILKTKTKELNAGLPTFQRLEKLIKNNHFIDSMNKEQMDRILNTYAHLLNTRKKLQQESIPFSNERQELLQDIKFGKSPELYVYGTVYPMVHITINKVKMLILNSLSNIKFTVFNDEIQIHPLKEETFENPNNSLA